MCKNQKNAEIFMQMINLDKKEYKKKIYLLFKNDQYPLRPSHIFSTLHVAGSSSE